MLFQQTSNNDSQTSSFASIQEPTMLKEYPDVMDITLVSEILASAQRPDIHYYGQVRLLI